MARDHNYYVYIMTNLNHNVLYTGVTKGLLNRAGEHEDGKDRASFTYRYNVTKLVYFKRFDHIEAAIAREKQIKAGSRKKKLDLINSLNPEWKDLSEDL